MSMMLPWAVKEDQLAFSTNAPARSALLVSMVARIWGK
jgi:hypothetical protein